MARQHRRMVCAAGLALLAAAAGAQAAAAPAAAGKPVELSGRIEAVTVYRGQAMVTRAVEVDAPAGGLEVVVTDLPAQVVPDSLFAGAEAGVKVRAVRFRARAVKEEPREEVRKLDDELAALQKALRKNQSATEALKQNQAYLKSLEDFASVKVKEEMVKGSLNADTVKAVAGFMFQQREELAAAALQLAEEQQDLQDKIALVQRQRAELAARFTRSAREAVVFLEKPQPGKTVLRLNYLVQGAAWAPGYNLRTQRAGDQVVLEYNALVQQTSGEDWSKVRLTLSTASPAMVAEAPILSPLWVALGSAPPADAKGSPEALFGGQRAYTDNLKKAMEARQQAPGAADQFAQDWAANEWANRLQIMDLVAGKDALLAGRELLVGDSALSVSYALGDGISVPSRSDQQMLQIASLQLKGEFYYLATPVLTSYVFQHADIINTSDVALLSGPVNSYADGQFMGTGRIPVVAKGQRFTVGFGVDTQLRVSRELADKTDRIQGGNRELRFKYRLLIDNYKDAPVKVRLMDRLPDPRGADIRVTLVNATDKVSEDPVYLRTLRKSGILRWEIEVPPKAAGATAKSIEYEYTVEFDRNLHLAEPPAAQIEKDKLDFQERLRAAQMAQ